MNKVFSVDEWRRERARGVILEYIRGVKPRATLNWCIGCLTKSFGLDPSESMLIIQSIRNDPTVIWDSEREKRLATLRRELERTLNIPTPIQDTYTAAKRTKKKSRAR